MPAVESYSRWNGKWEVVVFDPRNRLYTVAIHESKAIATSQAMRHAEETYAGRHVPLS